jgi:dipeptidyl aminopeptidase/acylaminoacyl peptidase
MKGTLLARVSLLAAVTAALMAPAAQGAGTRADYERSAALPGLTRNKVFKASVRPHWFGSGSRFWYRNDLAGGAREFIHVDAARGVREPAFDHARVAAALSTATGNTYTAMHLPLDALEFVEGQDAVRFAAAGKGWRLDRKTGELTEGPAPAAPAEAQRERPGQRRGQGRGAARAESPDGRWRAFVRDHNVFLKDLQSGDDYPLSEGGSAEDYYSERSLFWSPDSRKLVAVQTKRGGDRRVTLVESSPREQLQPRVQTLDYLKPGDPIPQPRPRLFDIASRKEIPVPDDVFPRPWSVQEVRWEPDGRRFTFLYNERGHQALRILAVDAENGQVRAIVDERSETFIDYAHKTFTRYLDATGEIIWMSERDGWNHLYLYDARTGAVKNPITRGEWVVREVDRVDEAARQIWFRAGGIYPGQDPYYVHYCRVNFDGTGLVRLTEGDGTHSIEYSPDGRYYLDTWSRVDLPPVTELRRSEDGKLVCELERADWSALLAAGWKAPERFVARGRDGKTDIYGVIFRPTTFDPARKYPVLEDIYAGPQGFFTPKEFRPYHSGQGMAELGFIVVKLDGMGTNWRSKAFHDVCWKNLGDAGFPDRVLWIKEAGRKYPYMDLERVGLYGGSAGGQSAMRALITHGDFYKAAVSVCGCHDNRMDKIWWNELWMGWPVGPHYEEQSNVTQAHRVQGKLLLIVGELDRNVDPASTLQVVDALIRANKDFEFLLIPGGGHGIGGPYGVRRQQDFFVRHLLAVEPRRN